MRLLSASSSFHSRKYFSCGADRAVVQALGVVAGEDDLHGGEEPFVEFRLLVGEVLPDAVADAHAAVLQFDDADGDAVHISTMSGRRSWLALERHFFGDGEVVLRRARAQLMRWTVSVTLPASIFTGTP